MSHRRTLRAMDPTRASIARLYNWYLSQYYREPNSHYYAIDEIVGQRVLDRCRFIPDLAYDNRQFLERTVDFMSSCGAQQFIDLGSGLPASKSVHDIAQANTKGARVVYVDNDEEAVTVTEQATKNNKGVAVIAHDMRDPHGVLQSPATRNIIDFREPVGLICSSSLPFIPDEDAPHQAIAEYMNALVPGSFLMVSHACLDEAPVDISAQVAGIADIYQEAGINATLRSRDQVAAFFTGLELVEPRVAFTCEWRPRKPVPSDYPARTCNYGAVGRKP